jgi:hypothetical protein
VFASRRTTADEFRIDDGMSLRGYTENAAGQTGPLDPGIKLLNKPYRRQDLAEMLRLVLDKP